MKKKLMALALAAAMMLSLLAGCSPSSSNTTNPPNNEDNPPKMSYEQGTDKALGEVDENRPTTKSTGQRYDYISFANSADPTDLNPWNKMLPGKFPIYEAIYEQLFDYIGGDYYPSIASGYEIVDDLHYRVTINDNVYDSEGNPLTVDDILVCYDNIVASGFAVKFDVFEKVEKEDDSTLMFTWNAPITGIGDLEHIWCNVQLYTQKAWEEFDFSTNPVGTGPYTLKSYTSGSSVIVEANDNYWRSKAGLEIPTWHEQNVQTIEFKVVTEASSNVIGLQTGELDFSSNIPTESFADFNEGGTYSDQFKIYGIADTGSIYIACNATEGKITADPNFRRAVYYAIDTDAVAAAVGSNAKGCKALGAAINPDYQTSWEDPEGIYSYNPDKAREYLAMTDYSGEKLVYMGLNTEGYKNAMTMVQALLLEVGIKVELNCIDSTLAATQLVDPEAYDLVSNNFGGNPLAKGYGRLLNNKEYGNGCAVAFVKDDKLQELFETASTVSTWNEETMTELINYVDENAYYLALFSSDTSIVCPLDCAEIYVMNSSKVIPNACTYYVD